MSAPWCQNPEPHGEHYEPMPVGYADMASVCFGRPDALAVEAPMGERPNAADVLARAMSKPRPDDDVSVTFDASFMVERGVIDALRAAVGATGGDIVCLLPDGTLSVAEQPKSPGRYLIKEIEDGD